MSQPRLVRFDSVEKLRDASAAWDDLWNRSEVTVPSARAELIAQWIEYEVPNAAFRALAVEQDGQLIAAMPLVTSRLRRFVPVGRLPYSEWTWAGDLLLDPYCDTETVLAIIAAGLRKCPWPMLWLDAVDLSAPRWPKFELALKTADLPVVTHQRFEVGRVEIDHDWTAYQASWSGNHRRQMRKSLKRAGELGGVDLVVHRPTDPREADTLLRRGFEVEDRSWKGAEGSSVLRSPRQFEACLRQARQLATWGNLELVFLMHAGQPIAFEYGWNCKGVYFPVKVGYDESFAALSPGQLLRYLLFERFYSDPERRTVDFVGPLVNATAKWSTASYSIGRLVAGCGGNGGNALLWAYRQFRRRRDDARPRTAVSDAALPAEPVLS